MKKEKKIKPLPCYENFFNYFVSRAKRVMKVKNKEIKSIHIDAYNEYPATGNVIVWFHGKNDALAKANFSEDGKVLLAHCQDFRR